MRAPRRYLTPKAVEKIVRDTCDSLELATGLDPGYFVEDVQMAVTQVLTLVRKEFNLSLDEEIGVLEGEVQEAAP